MPGYELMGREELAEIQDVFDHGAVLFRHGFDALRQGRYKVKDFEAAMAARLGVPHALAVSSGTAALRVALAGLGLGAGDEVITQAFTFVATVEAIIESRATPVCAEVDATLNMDPVDLARRITPRTKAVIVVHMLGTPARLPEIQALCDAHGLALIEDTAWGLGGALHGRPLGTWGAAGTLSFDFAKTLTTGEGGMVVCRDPDVWARCAAWHDHGHENNPALPRWEDSRSSSGFNFRMGELAGAVGLAQLRKLDGIVGAQRAHRDRLWAAIADLPGVSARAVPAGAYETADALVFFVPDADAARRSRAALLAHGLATKILPEATRWHFAGTWTHMPELVRAHGGDLRAAFPQSSRWLARAVAMPVGVSLADDAPQRARAALSEALALDLPAAA
ncbi:MAG: DegT/DnrJ/EryC1/StrS family aminotransferase [Burkholderiaceae bacterium]|nr:DegT/DnrJ/EryC1/StrS family aminotransferase [Burkholderiaceae bacterium]